MTQLTSKGDFLVELSKVAYENMRDPAHPGHQYLVGRSLDPQVLLKFQVGAASKLDITSVLNNCSQELQDLDWTRDIVKSWGDEVKVIFPVYNAIGKLVAVQTRSILEKLFRQHSLDDIKFDGSAMFGSQVSLPIVWESEIVWVFEAAIDMLSFYQMFRKTPVLSTLTHGITANQVKFLTRYAKKIVLVFDRDARSKMDNIASRVINKVSINTMPWKRVPGIEITDLKDCNDLLIKLGRYKAKRYIEAQFPELAE